MPAVNLRKHRLLHIDENILRSMASNATFVREFPFLSGLINRADQAAGKKPCGRCGQKAKVRADAFGAAKRSLATMDKKKKSLLLQMLDAQQIRLVFSPNEKLTIAD